MALVVFLKLHNFLKLLNLYVLFINKSEKILFLLFFESDLFKELFLHLLKLFVDIFGLFKLAF